MLKYKTFFKKFFRNKIIQYVFSRYATYIIHFINSVFIAILLGPYYLGVWGFITLIIQYINQINLGISHSVNTLIAINKKNEWYVHKVIGSSITMLFVLSCTIILFFSANEFLNLNIGSKYNFSTYAIFVVLIGVLGYFNTLFSNIFRVYGKVIEIAINQSAFPLLVLFCLPFFKGENLLWALIIANLLAAILSFCLYIFNKPINFNFLFIPKLSKKIQVRGWHLFIYNTSFHFIIITTRSFVSYYFPVNEFGYFTFAFSLANVVLLLLQSFSFLIFPKMLNRMANAPTQKIVDLLNQVRDTYISTSHLLVHFVIFIFPLFLLVFPQYSESSKAFKIIALTIVLYTSSFGYIGMLIAKGVEKKLGFLSFSALIINIISAYTAIKVFNVTFTYVIVATMFTYFIYVVLLSYMGRKKLSLNTNLSYVLKDAFPIQIILPYLFSFGLIIFSIHDFYFILPLSLFILLNWKNLTKIKNITTNIISNPSFIDV